MSGQETGGLRERIAEAIFNGRAGDPYRYDWQQVQELVGLAGYRADALQRADAVLAVVQPLLDAADARHRDMLTGLRDATLRAETAETEVARLMLAAQAEVETAERWRTEAEQAEAERDRLREAVTRVREILDYFDGQVTALENGNPAVGSAFRFTFNKIRAALDQPEDQPETPMTDPLSIPCPACLTPAGEQCHESDNVPRPPHRTRVKAAERQQGATEGNAMTDEEW